MSSSIARIPLLDTVCPTADDIQQRLCADWPDLIVRRNAESREFVTGFSVGGADVVIGYVPAPVTNATRTSPANGAWPLAWQEIDGHRSHLELTVSDSTDFATRACLLTQVAAAILGWSDQALGVYWAAAGHLVPRDVFLHGAHHLLPLRPPVELWVHIETGEGFAGGSIGFTQGLQELGHLEVEVPYAPSTPDALRQQITAVVADLLVECPSYSHAASPMRTDEAELGRGIVACHDDSIFGHWGHVLRLDFQIESITL